MYGLRMKVKCKAGRLKFLMEEFSPADGKRTVPAHAGTQRKLQLEKGGGRQDALQVLVIHIAPAGNAPRQQSEFQRLPAEGVGVQREFVGSRGAQLPIRLFPVVIHGDAVNRVVVLAPRAE